MEDFPNYLRQLPVPGEEFFASIALVNTRFLLGHGPVDLLEDGEAARLWLVRREILPDRTEWTGRERGRLVALREALRELFEARSLFEAHGAQVAPSQACLDTFNGSLTAAPATSRLVWTPAGPRREQQTDTADPAGAALSLLAEDGAELLTGPDAAQLAACAAQGCTRWFLRSHAARRWCTTRCGNRVRAARHYASRKQP